jgi:hypothetical protein
VPIHRLLRSNSLALALRLRNTLERESSGGKMNIFETADGSAHWPSIITMLGWLIGSMVTGGVLLATLHYNRNERVRVAEEKAPWKLSPQQEQVIIERITAGPKGKVALEFSAADRIRVRDFAHTLGALFGSAGLEVWGYIPAFQEAPGPPIVGLRIGVKPGVAASVGLSLRDALAAAGLVATVYPNNNNNYADDFAVVMVGMKP